jgi:hypothetical protein
MGAQRLVAVDDTFAEYQAKETGGRTHQTFELNSAEA